LGTFRAFTSDWSKHKHSLGTQNFLLDIAMSRPKEFDVHYSAYIVDEFLFLLGNIFDGPRRFRESVEGPHLGAGTVTCNRNISIYNIMCGLDI
jgi:hypothetical protein